MAREGLEQPVKRAGRGSVGNRDQQGRPVLAARRENLAAEYEETRGVVGAILDLRRQHLEAVDLRRGLPCDGGGAPLVARATGGLAVARYGHELDTGQVLLQPGAALRERLRV